MPGRRTPPGGRKPPRSMLIVGSGWIVLSGIGLLVGGTTGGLILGFASQMLVAYTVWQTYQGREPPDQDSDE